MTPEEDKKQTSPEDEATSAQKKKENADAAKGRRPDFTAAAKPPEANRLYEYFVSCLAAKGIKVKTGVFAADMTVEIINDGPVTIMLDTRDTARNEKI